MGLSPTIRSMKLPISSRASIVPTVVLVMALTSCGGSSEPASAPSTSESVTESQAATTPAPSSDSALGDEEAEGEAGFESTGSLVADQNREEYIIMGATDEELDGVSWAGDVKTEDGKFVEYGDGLRIDFVSAEPAEITAESDALDERDPDKSVVTIKLKVSNSGDAPLPIDSSWVPMFVYTGANLEQADQFVGYGEPELTSEDAQNAVGAGSSFEVWMSFQVEPGAPLEVATNPDYFGNQHTPFVFTGVTAP